MDSDNDRSAADNQTDTTDDDCNEQDTMEGGVVAPLRQTLLDAMPVGKNKKTKTAKEPPPPLHPALAKFDFKTQFNLITVQSEKNPRPKTMEESRLHCRAACEIKFPPSNDNPDGQIFLLSRLRLSHLKEFATRCGLKNLGSVGKFQIRCAIAERLKYGPNGVHEAVLKKGLVSVEKSSSYMRAVNVAFHPDFFNSYLKINDYRTRQTFETGNGAKNERLYADMADEYNNKDNEDLNFFAIEDFETSDEIMTRFKEWDEAGICTRNFIPCTAESLEGMLVNLGKIHSHILNLMSRSGEHSNDALNYCAAAIKKNQLSSEVSKEAAYYFFIHCEIHPELNTVLQKTLPADAKGSSDSIQPRSQRSKKKAAQAANETALAKLAQAVDRFAESSARAVVSSETDKLEQKYFNFVAALGSAPHEEHAWILARMNKLKAKIDAAETIQTPPAAANLTTEQQEPAQQASSNQFTTPSTTSKRVRLTNDDTINVSGGSYSSCNDSDFYDVGGEEQEEEDNDLLDVGNEY